MPKACFDILAIMIYIFLAIIFYTATILVGTSASRNISPNLASGIMNAVSAIIPIIISIPLIGRKYTGNNRHGVIMAVITGISIAFFTIAINKSYSVNKVGVVAPMVFGGAILSATLLSTLIFKEKITPVEALGLAFITIGFAVLVYARAVTK